ncbi:B3 domain-containing protein REM13-like [Euphorbia lathyris]|uniref:B3 domain-containing protein REM13-like n=1 Tax=Euphorbia lathyris TaxID=212925 RepID=UPI0033140CBD
MTRKLQEDDDLSFNILERSPKFFKTIIQETIQEGRLAIPRKFVKEHGDCLSNQIITKVPDGTIWKMELLKSRNYEAFLEKGWKEFSEHYSLKHGFILLFQYQHKSNFLVFIFDTTLLEIPYTNLEQNPIEVIEIEDSELECIPNESKQALEVADEFRSINPWFKVVLKPSHGKFCHLTIPIGFMREHMDYNLERVILKIEGGQSGWSTKMIIYWKSCTARLSTGWSDFVKDNCLKNKDVCVFELVAPNELKVHIFRI